MILTTLASVDSGRRTLDVVIRTALGDIVAELYARDAPATTQNFLRYVDAGHYSGGVFHRTVTPANQPNNPVRIEVIQASVNPKRESESLGAIPLERTRSTGIRHRDGTISMARDAPDSATSDFFICIGDQPELDFGGRRNPDGQGFAAFGRVIRGMEIVRRIQMSPSKDQALTPPVKILEIRRRPDSFSRLYD